MKIKYIVTNCGTCSIFPGYIQHDVAARPHQSAGFDIVGAGFIDMIDGIVDCHGESVSLRIKSNGIADSRIVAAFLGLSVDEDTTNVNDFMRDLEERAQSIFKMYRAEYPSYRLGQAYVIACSQLDAALYSRVCQNLDADCFYDDNKIPQFIDYVRTETK